MRELKLIPETSVADGSDRNESQST
jgi:hypothetical protein